MAWWKELSQAGCQREGEISQAEITALEIHYVVQPGLRSASYTSWMQLCIRSLFHSIFIPSFHSLSQRLETPEEQLAPN